MDLLIVFTMSCYGFTKGGVPMISYGVADDLLRICQFSCYGVTQRLTKDMAIA